MNAIECTHHWILEGQNGPKSMGICKKCSDKKEFSNVTEERKRGRRNPINGSVAYVPDIQLGKGVFK